MKPAEFLDLLVPAARECHRITGIPASVTLAQAALESGWGASKLAKLGKNLFGIKADKSWKGETVDMPTREVIKGKELRVMAKWRAYPTWSASMLDRAAFLKRMPRYAKCFQQTTAGDWCRELQAAGYATDPKYQELLMDIIDGRNLTRFDNLEAP